MSHPPSARWPRTFAPVAHALALVLALAALVAPAPLAARTLVLEGDMVDFMVHPQPKPAVEASFDDLAGGRVDLAQYRGRVVLLNVWATWCAPCIAEMPSLNRLAGSLDPERAVVLAVSADFRQDMVPPFLARHDLGNLIVVHDDQRAMVESFGIQPLPTTLLIDAEGREVARLQGDAHWDDGAAERLIASLLGDAAPQ